MTAIRFNRFYVAILVAAAAANVMNAAELSPLERRGREIYTRGKGADEPIVAVLGDGQTTIDASIVPCASCHGADGKGRAEGGIVPSDITLAALSVAHDDSVQGGRKRPAYTDRLIKKALTMGTDSGGNKLGPTMPRYKMSIEDMDALLAYLKKVGDARDPGLSTDSIRIGVILPPREHLAGVGEEVRKLLQAFVDSRNAADSIYERKLELVFTGADGAPSARALATEAFIAREQPFALVSSFTDGADDELAAVAEKHGIPLLATISSRAQSGGTSRRYVRDLVAGIADQTRALAQFIGRRFPNAKVAVLHGRDEHSKSVAEAAMRELEGSGAHAVLKDSTTPPRTLKENGIDTILYAGAPEELAALALSTRELEWTPTILVSSALIHPSALDRSKTSAKVFIALPIGPGDQSPDAIAAWRKLAADDGANAKHQIAQFGALASVHLLIAALQRAGRDLSREKLLEAVDAIAALETGLVPPLTFTPTRHVGSTGAYVVAISEGNEVVWVDPG